MKFYKLILFAVIFIALVIAQRDIINPLLFDVASSDFFLEESEDKGAMNSISTPMTDIAFMHCNNYIREELDEEIIIYFQSKPVHAWGIGGQQYVINGEIETTSDNSPSVLTKYVCRIHFSNGSNEDEAMKFENWSVYGVSGLENL